MERSCRIRVPCRSCADSLGTGSGSKTPAHSRFHNGPRRRRIRRCKPRSCMLSVQCRWVASRASSERVRPPAEKPARRVLLFASVLLVGDSAELLDNLLPAFAHILERSIVLREHEAGVDKAKARSVLGPGKDERNDGVERRAVPDIAFVAGFPGVDEA